MVRMSWGLQILGRVCFLFLFLPFLVVIVVLFCFVFFFFVFHKFSFPIGFFSFLPFSGRGPFLAKFCHLRSLRSWRDLGGSAVLFRRRSREKKSPAAASPLASRGGSVAKKVPRTQESRQLRRLPFTYF